MRSRTRTIAALACAMLLPLVVRASVPSIATLDSEARSSGNRKDVAERVGAALFAVKWPAQVMKVSANAVDASLVVGLKVSGVKFHGPLTRAAFEREAIALIGRTFATDTSVTEVDLWTAVPLTVGRGAIVSGDLATPTTRNVFTVSVLRSESAAELAARIKAGRGTYWDEDWTRAAFKGTN